MNEFGHNTICISDGPHKKPSQRSMFNIRELLIPKRFKQVGVEMDPPILVTQSMTTWRNPQAKQIIKFRMMVQIGSVPNL